VIAIQSRERRGPAGKGTTAARAVGNPKHQAPSHKQIQSFKSDKLQAGHVGVWNVEIFGALKLVWNLVLVIWCFASHRVAGERFGVAWRRGRNAAERWRSILASRKSTGVTAARTSKLMDAALSSFYRGRDDEF
jgi:hypothetical protein